VRVEGRG